MVINLILDIGNGIKNLNRGKLCEEVAHVGATSPMLCLQRLKENKTANLKKNTVH